MGDGEISIATETGVEATIACGAILDACDLVSNKALLDQTDVPEVYAISDCEALFNIVFAIRGGNHAGRAL